MPYENTDRKRLIRVVHDLELLRMWEAERGRKLSYFGLTGPGLYDIEDWKEVLAREITSVEEDTAAGRELLPQMESNAAILGVDDGFQILRGRIEDVINSGDDVRRRRPQCSAAGKKGIVFRYDVVNLDFDGGIGNNRDRVEAIGHLISRQAEFGCLLFLTLSPRSKQSQDLQHDIRQLVRSKADPAVSAAIDWYRSPDAKFEIYRLKAIVPLVMQDCARSNRLAVECHVPITYIGSGNTRMIHFAFTMRPQAQGVRGSTNLSDDEVLLFPLLDSRDEGLMLADRQVPGMRMDLLPDYLKRALLPSGRPAQRKRRPK